MATFYLRDKMNRTQRIYTKIKDYLWNSVIVRIPYKKTQQGELLQGPYTLNGILQQRKDKPMNKQPHGGSKYLLIPSETGLSEKECTGWMHITNQNTPKATTNFLIFIFTDTSKPTEVNP